MTALIVLSIILALIGIFSLSQATVGVGLIALACLFGIYARIAQASAKTTQGSPQTSRQENDKQL